jgi:hypothetical protein
MLNVVPFVLFRADCRWRDNDVPAIALDIDAAILSDNACSIVDREVVVPLE